MNHYFAVVQRIVGLLLTSFSTTMLVPVAVALLYGDGEIEAFMAAFLITLATGLATWLPVRHVERELKIRDGFLVVVLFWFVLGLFGAIPLYLSEYPSMSATDAAFEAVSGLTTTGATTLIGLDKLPHAVLFWRALLHWMGGMGIIVLAVAVLPMLGVGGMQLFRAETPGPMKDDKLTPRIKETAKVLWLTYIAITAACAVSYWMLGMGPFDAVTHAFSTIATGGFSNYDDSMAHFHSDGILIASILFMWLSGASFSLHFITWRSRSARPYFTNLEFHAYTGIMIGASALISLVLYLHSTFASVGQDILQGSYQTVSIMTSTGFTSANFSVWPSFLPILLMLIACIGGCAGSTAGGIKVIRVALLFKQARREIMGMVHPNAELPVKIEKRIVSERVVKGVWAFFFMYVAGFATMVILLMALGLSALTAFSSVAACINNMGPALGTAAANFIPVGPAAKWVLIVAMIGGRLEIFTLFVVFTPAFWRR